MPKIPTETAGGERERLLEMGRRIEAAREGLGLQQNEFAVLVGVEPPTVSGWESGKHGVTSANMARIVTITGEPSSYFMPERLPKKNTIERLSRELGTILGKPRLLNLLDMPEKRLRRDIDAILGEFIIQERERRPRRK